MQAKTSLKTHIMNSVTNILWQGIDIFAETFPIIGGHYYQKIIGKEYEKECKQFQINETDSILHIGCGTFPLTELMLSSTCNPKQILGIDNNKRTAMIAKHFLSTKYCNKTIRISHGDGTKFDINGFSIIIISSCASPKTTILEHVVEKAHPKTKIILREVESLAKEIMTFAESQKNLHLIDSISHHPFPFVKPFGWISFLLIKEENK